MGHFLVAAATSPRELSRLMVQFPGELPDFRIPAVWKKGRLYAISKNLEGYPVIKRYRVTWSD
jgi:hypothetical protein